MSTERIRKLNDFLLKDPDDSFTRYALALEHAGSGETARAAGMLEDLIGRDPAFVASYQLLGQLYADLRRTEDARRVLTMGIERARAANEPHAAGEMQDALDDLPS